MQALPLFFSGLSSLGALGSNTASLLGALKYRFSFGCPKEPLFFLGLSTLGVSDQMPLLFWVPKNTAFLLCLSNLAALGSNTFSLFWVPKNTAFLLCAQQYRFSFWPCAQTNTKLVGPKKKSGVFGHPKEKRYLIREPLSYSGPKRKAVFLGTQKNRFSVRLCLPGTRIVFNAK
jgi:hypothetical protein